MYKDQDKTRRCSLCAHTLAVLHCPGFKFDSSTDFRIPVYPPLCASASYNFLENKGGGGKNGTLERERERGSLVFKVWREKGMGWDSNIIIVKLVTSVCRTVSFVYCMCLFHEL